MLVTRPTRTTPGGHQHQVLGHPVRSDAGPAAPIGDGTALTLLSTEVSERCRPT